MNNVQKLIDRWNKRVLEIEDKWRGAESGSPEKERYRCEVNIIRNCVEDLKWALIQDDRPGNTP